VPLLPEPDPRRSQRQFRSIVLRVRLPPKLLFGFGGFTQSIAVRRYHVCLRLLGVSHTGQRALTACGITLIVTEPSASTARLAIRQRSVPTSRSSTFTAALPPPAYSRFSFTGCRSPRAIGQSIATTIRPPLAQMCDVGECKYKRSWDDRRRSDRSGHVGNSAGVVQALREQSGMSTPIRATLWIQGVGITSSETVWLSLARCFGASLAR
jgi:hypothetical protein